MKQAELARGDHRLTAAAATVTDTDGTYGFLAAADRTAVCTAINNLVADVANVKQVVNQLIDDLQANGLLA